MSPAKSSRSHTDGRQRLNMSQVISPDRNGSKGILSRQSWSLLSIVPLLLLVAAGCSQTFPSPQSVDTRAAPSTVTVSEVATASVLIVADPDDAPTSVADIRIAPSSIVIDRGDTLQLSAEAVDPDGLPIPNVELVWNTLDPRAGVVTREGTFGQARLAPMKKRYR